MELYTFQNLNFTYPQADRPALSGIDLSIQAGEFIILCGPSGCGKSTLLRQFKTCLTPHGAHSGTLLFTGKPLAQIPAGEQAGRIGFVLQSPENQVVTDKVWHELAFGLESLGCDQNTIRRRVAEIAAFFGIEHWFYRDVTDLSGGQKQLLSLACVMAMQPEVLVLDEPTAQLDPIAAVDFLALLGRIHRELGTTVILSEHRLEEAFPYATRVVVMESGRIVTDGAPKAVALELKNQHSPLFAAMPAALGIWAGVDTSADVPITVPQGKEFLAHRAEESPLLSLPPANIPEPGDTVLRGKELWFRYTREGTDIVRGLDVTLRRGELLALMGGNGSGKTTTLKLLAGLLRPQRGNVSTLGKIGYLPQNPQTLFVKNTIREDLYQAFPEKADEAALARVVNLCGLTDVLDRHPYDVSGGEQQRSALAKVLLTQPEILLLDEPTKGFDAGFKATFAAILKTLCAQGIAVLMVSHDVAFCAQYAHRCALYFDGQLVAQGTPREFFSGSTFYTTPANRIARDLQPQAVTVGDVIAICGGQLPEQVQPELPDAPLPPPPRQSSEKTGLPWWRKLLALAGGVLSLGIFLFTLRSGGPALLFSGGSINGQGRRQLVLYGLLVISLAVTFLAVSRRNAPPAAKKKRPSLRTLAACLCVLLLIPATIYIGIFPLGGKHYNLVALAVLLECMLPFALVFEGRKPQARELVTIAVLCALGVAGRSVFYALPQFKPVLALTVIAGVALGAETGFLVGAVTMLTSNVLFSQGPWTPWQMFAMGMAGFLAGLVFGRRGLGRSPAALSIFGGLAAVAVYGGIMNFSSAITWNPQSLTFPILAGYYLTGLPMDLVHGAATALFLALIGKPMLEKLERLQSKYGIVQ